MRSWGEYGKPMMVNLPNEGWHDTGEGGLAFFLCVKTKAEYKDRRQACLAGEIIWPYQDVCLTPYYDHKNDEGIAIDAGMLIGSTGYSLYSDYRDQYFQPTFDDLTPQGQKLYKLLKTIYGEVDIVTLLDT